MAAALREALAVAMDVTSETQVADGFAEVLSNPQPYQPTREAVRKVFNTERTLDAYESLMERLVYRRRVEKAAKVNSPEPVTDAERPTR